MAVSLRPTQATYRDLLLQNQKGPGLLSTREPERSRRYWAAPGMSVYRQPPLSPFQSGEAPSFPPLIFSASRVFLGCDKHEQDFHTRLFSLARRWQEADPPLTPPFCAPSSTHNGVSSLDFSPGLTGFKASALSLHRHRESSGPVSAPRAPFLCG